MQNRLGVKFCYLPPTKGVFQNIPLVSDPFSRFKAMKRDIREAVQRKIQRDANYPHMMTLKLNRYRLDEASARAFSGSTG